MRKIKSVYIKYISHFSIGRKWTTFAFFLLAGLTGMVVGVVQFTSKCFRNSCGSSPIYRQVFQEQLWEQSNLQVGASGIVVGVVQFTSRCFRNSCRSSPIYRQVLQAQLQEQSNLQVDVSGIVVGVVQFTGRCFRNS